MRRFLLTALLLAAFLGTAGVVYAQTRDTTAARQGMSGMTDMMRACPMITAMDQGPQAALEHADALGLTDEQRRRLTELKQAAQDARDVLTTEQRAKLGELRRDRAMQRMERMMRMMNMMMGMTDMMVEMSDSGTGMDGMRGRR